MARLYKTASANPLDYMYRINVPLMEQVLMANDQYITENLAQLSQLDNVAAAFPFLEPDEARAREITEGYASKIEDITKAIRSDPANWRKQLEPIRTVSRDLQQNYKVGEISKIAGNYNKYKKVSDAIDEQVKQFSKDGKGISADRAKAYKQYFLSEFIKANPKGTSYDPKTGEYNALQAYEPMANIDIRKMLGEELDKIKADKSSYKKDEVTGQEWYFNKKTNTWEGVTPEKILNIVTDRLNNPQLMDYLRQDSQVGLIRNVVDQQGNFINPYTYKGVPVSPEEKVNIENIRTQISKQKNPALKNQLQSQLSQYINSLNSRRSLQWNDDSYLAPILRGLVNQHSYSQTEQFDELRNNSRGSTLYVQGQLNARQNRALANARGIAEMREAGINDRFNKTMDWNKYKWDNPQAKPGTTKTGSKKDEKPIESSVSRVSTNSFEDWTTTDSNTGETVKVLSNSGLSSDINRLKKEESDTKSVITNLDKIMKDKLGNRKIEDLTLPELNSYNSLRVQKEALEKKLPQITSDLNSRRQWYKASVDAALTNNPAAKRDKDGDVAADLTPEEIALYNKYENDRDAKKKMEDIKKSAELQGFVFKGANEGAYGNKFTQWLDGVVNNTPEHRELRKDVTNYLKVKAKVDERRDNFLAQMRYTPIDTDAVQLGTQDSEDIARMIFSNTQGLKMYDNTGNKSDKIDLEGKGISWFNPKGDNSKMTFADNEIMDYIAKHNVKVDFEQVGNTTKIGTGNAIVKVSFKDPNKEIPNTPFYIEVTPELQKQIGNKLSQSKSPDVKAIANNLLDDEINDIRKQLITPTIKRTAGADDDFDPVTFTIFINRGNERIPLQVTKFVNSNGIDHLNITKSVDGVQVPIESPNGIPGWFNGADDFLNYYKSQTRKTQ